MYKCKITPQNTVFVFKTKTKLAPYKPDVLDKMLILKTPQLKQSKEEGNDQEPIQSSTTPDPGHHVGK